MTAPKISCCIPTFEEKDYILKTIMNLKKQTIKPEIVIADYDPYNTFSVYKTVKDLNVKYVRIFKPGIGFARAEAVRYSSGDYILSYDADCVFNRFDALELMVEPLKTEAFACTYVKTYTDSFESGFDPTMYDLYNIRNMVSAFSPFVAFDQAVMFSRVAYNQTDGYPDVQMAETVKLMAQFFHRFANRAFMFLEQPVIFTSPRRGKNILDYTTAFRKEGAIKIN